MVARSRRATAAWAGLIAAAAASAARAADIYWAKPVSGNYTTASDWVGGVTPGTSDVAHLNAYNSSGSPYTLTLTNNVTTAGLDVTALNTQVTVNLNGYSWNQSSSGADPLMVNVSSGGVYLNIGNGYLNTTVPSGYTTAIGQSSSGQSEMSLTSNTRWINNGSLTVGSLGELDIGNSASVYEYGSLVTGLYSGASQAAISIEGGRLTVYDDDEYVGESGAGEILQSGGFHTVNANLLLGVYNGSSGGYSMGGTAPSLVVTGNEFVGYLGRGGFEQSQGNHQINGNLYVGFNPTAVGYFLLNDANGAGTTLSVAGAEVIGQSAAGQSNQSASALFIQEAGTHSIGTSSSPTSLTIGVNSGSSASYQLSGGTLNLYGNLGIAVNAGSTGSFDFTGGTFNPTGTVSIGQGGTGTMTVESSASMTTSGAVAVAANANSVGQLNVDGILIANNVEEHIGEYGTGTLFVSGIHTVNANLLLGVYAGSVGYGYVEGSGTLTNGGYQFVGYSGTGNMLVEDGIQQVNGTLVVGTNASSLGTETLEPAVVIQIAHPDDKPGQTGAPQVVVTGSEVIAAAATGNSQQPGGFFNQSAGTNTVGSLVIAQSTGSTGAYQLSAGSLTSSSSITIGQGGTATFNQSGGTVGTPSLTLAGSGGSVGSMNLTSNASVLIGSGSQPGNGAMQVSSSGVITTAGTASITTTGSLLNAGTLNVSSGGFTYTGTASNNYFNNSGGINVTGNATATFTGPGQVYSLISYGTVNVAAGSILSLPDGMNNYGTITVNGTLQAAGFSNSGTATISGAQVYPAGTTYNNFAGTTTFNTDIGPNLIVTQYGGAVIYNASQHLSGLNVTGNQTVTTPSSGKRAIVFTPSLSVSGTLNLTSNDLDVQGGGTSYLATVTNLVKQGYANGSWNGSGIDSSTAAQNAKHITALGVILNNQDGSAIYGSGTGQLSFEGSTPAANDVLVKYTYYGDANLDGSVDGSDYSKIDAGFSNHGTVTGWLNGDFNYDGKIDGSDYTLIDDAFNSQGANLSNTALIASSTAEIAGNSSVPEPASVALMLIAAASLRRRRIRVEPCPIALRFMTF